MLCSLTERKRWLVINALNAYAERADELAADMSASELTLADSWREWATEARDLSAEIQEAEAVQLDVEGR